MLPSINNTDGNKKLNERIFATKRHQPSFWYGDRSCVRYISENKLMYSDLICIGMNISKVIIINIERNKSN